MRRLKILFAPLVASCMLLGACSSGGAGGTNGPGASADVLRVAADGEPSTLDWMATTSGYTQMAGIQTFETLYALDESYTPVPQLASAVPDVSADGLTYTIPLRTDVKFHDGSTMTADDVVASLKRWAKVSPNGQAMFEHVSDIKAVNDATVEINLSSPFDVVRMLAVPIAPAAITPAEVADTAGTDLIEKVNQIVGTGPYQLVEWKKGKSYTLEKFEDYKSPDNGASGGPASAKPATYKSVVVSFVEDATTRTQSTIGGQYDVGLSLPGSFYDQLKSASSVSTEIISPFYSLFLVLNSTRPPFDNPDVRKAASLALDRDGVCGATFGSSDLYTVNGAVYSSGMGVLSSTAGDTDATQDLDAAKALLAGAGYNGEEIELPATKDWGPAYYDASIAIEQQLTAAGFNVKVVTGDGGSTWDLVSGKKFDLYVDDFGIGYVMPQSHLLLGGNYPSTGQYKSPDMTALFQKWNEAVSDDERAAVMDDIQTQFLTDLPDIKMCDHGDLRAGSNSVATNDTYYWPTWWAATPK